MTSSRDSLYLISCVSRKQFKPMRARDLYCSDWFLKVRAYVEALDARWLILSAKYGVVDPDEVIAPYEVTLNSMGTGERREWAHRVTAQLRSRCHRGDTVVILAGESYREHLVPILKEWGCAVEVPMRGLGIGRQLAWLKNHLAHHRGTRS